MPGCESGETSQYGTGIEIRFNPHRTTTLQLSLPSHVIRRRFEYQVQGSFGGSGDGFEELNGVAPYVRLLPLGERPTQLRQGDILQLPNPLSGHSEFLANFFENFRFAAVQPESHQDNLALAVVQHFQKLAKFVAHVLVSERLEGRLRIFITDDLAKCG